MGDNFVKDWIDAFRNTSEYKDTVMLDIMTRRKMFEKNLDDMWENYRCGNPAQIVEYQKGVNKIKGAGLKVLRNSAGKHRIVHKQI